MAVFIVDLGLVATPTVLAFIGSTKTQNTKLN